MFGRHEITGIKAADLRDAPSFRQVRRTVLNIFGNQQQLLVGHGLRHDLACLRVDYPPELLRWHFCLFLQLQVHSADSDYVYCCRVLSFIQETLNCKRLFWTQTLPNAVEYRCPPLEIKMVKHSLYVPCDPRPSVGSGIKCNLYSHPVGELQCRESQMNDPGINLLILNWKFVFSIAK